MLLCSEEDRDDLPKWGIVPSYFFFFDALANLEGS
jgi:hypothetical protein